MIVNFFFYFFSCCFWKFTDEAFPPDNTSLGSNDSVIWIRLSDLDVTLKDGKKGKVTCLFSDGIQPYDVCQGALGDCWLLAGLVTLCERPAFIQNCFISPSFSPFGKYTIRLYDEKLKKFVRVTIDDYVPCDPHTKMPIYTNLVNNEVWPLVIEKAYAKFKGSYKNLNGGLPLKAMITITGYHGENISFPRVGAGDTKATDELFKRLQYLHNHGCLLAAGSKGEDLTRERGRGSVKSSIVGGHAYSILAIKTPMLTTSNVRLLKLRNPWGSFEWKGDWGDNSPLWDQYHGVALELGKPDKVEDGIFYIAWEDFIKLFSLVDVLYPNYGVDNLHLSIDESRPIIGSCTGCVTGCASYWCLCRGLRILWCQQESTSIQHDYSGVLVSHAGKGIRTAEL